jgi:TPR repeat protein
LPAVTWLVTIRYCLAATAHNVSWSSAIAWSGRFRLQRQDYVAASRAFIPLPERGNVAAQSHLGYTFETGRGVPQNYAEAAMWYRRAAVTTSLNIS